MEFLIKELSRLVKLTPRTIRYYEQEGLLPPAVRTSGGYRTFGVEDMAVLLRIKRLRTLGFGIDQIRQILDAPDSPEAMSWLRELDAKLKRDAARIKSQRATIALILKTGAPLDVVPEFATGLSERVGKAYTDAAEVERDKLRAEILDALGTEADRRVGHEIQRMQAHTETDPLMGRLADLDARFAEMNVSASDDEVQQLVDGYVDALTQLSERIRAMGMPMGSPLPEMDARQMAELTAGFEDEFHAGIVRRATDELLRRRQARSDQN